MGSVGYFGLDFLNCEVDRKKEKRKKKKEIK
jgi:hypothetical protein